MLDCASGFGVLLDDLGEGLRWHLSSIIRCEKQAARGPWEPLDLGGLLSKLGQAQGTAHRGRAGSIVAPRPLRPLLGRPGSCKRRGAGLS